MRKTHYTCRELAELRLPELPGTDRAWRDLVEREAWEFIEHKSRGRGGIRREYAPPPRIAKLIDRHLRGEAVTEEEVIRARVTCKVSTGPSAGQQTQTACAGGAKHETAEKVVTLTVTLPVSEAAALLQWLKRRGGHA